MRVPTLKILDTLAVGPATEISFQSTHLSLQEYLCAEQLCESLSIESSTLNVGFDYQTKAGVCKVLSAEAKKNMWRLGAEMGLAAPLLARFNGDVVGDGASPPGSNLDLSGGGLTTHGGEMLLMLLAGSPFGSALVVLALSDCNLKFTLEELTERLQWAVQLREIDLRDNDLCGPALKSNVAALTALAPELSLVSVQGNFKVIRDTLSHADQADTMQLLIAQQNKHTIVQQSTVRCKRNTGNRVRGKDSTVVTFVAVITQGSMAVNKCTVKLADPGLVVAETWARMEHEPGVSGTVAIDHSLHGIAWAWELDVLVNYTDLTHHELGKGGADKSEQHKERHPQLKERWLAAKDSVQLSHFGEWRAESDPDLGLGLAAELVGATVIEHHQFEGRVDLTGDLVVPDGVVELGTHAFTSCKGISTVFLPATVANVENYAFYCCTSLQEARVPFHTTVAADAFPGSCTVTRYSAVVD
jgi:hypothetical protein